MWDMQRDAGGRWQRRERERERENEREERSLLPSRPEECVNSLSTMCCFVMRPQSAGNT